MFDLLAIDAKLTTTMWKMGVMAAEATATESTNISDIVKKAKDSNLSTGQGKALYDKTQDVGQLGYQIVFGIVTIGVLIAIVLKGFQFAMATAADRDEKKKSLAHVAIGGLIVFAATGIATTLAKFGADIFPG